jgi:RNA-directed DNA polymerase
LGAALKAAIQHDVSSLSYWRMARTHVTHQAMSNTWLNEQGLISVKYQWCSA